MKYTSNKNLKNVLTVHGFFKTKKLKKSTKETKTSLESTASFVKQVQASKFFETSNEDSDENSIEDSSSPEKNGKVN